MKKIKVLLTSTMVAAIMFVGISASAGTGEGPGKKAPAKKEVKAPVKKEADKKMFANLWYFVGGSWTTDEPENFSCGQPGEIRCYFDKSGASGIYTNDATAKTTVDNNYTTTADGAEVLDASHSNAHTGIILHKRETAL